MPNACILDCAFSRHPIGVRIVIALGGEASALVPAFGVYDQVNMFSQNSKQVFASARLGAISTTPEFLRAACVLSRSCFHDSTVQTHYFTASRSSVSPLLGPIHAWCWPLVFEVLNPTSAAYYFGSVLHLRLGYWNIFFCRNAP